MRTGCLVILYLVSTRRAACYKETEPPGWAELCKFIHILVAILVTLIQLMIAREGGHWLHSIKRFVKVT